MADDDLAHVEAEREHFAHKHPTPPGPPGPPMHDHPDGSRCMWVQRGGIDRWRQVDHIGTDLGPCPGFDQPRDHFSDVSHVECTCGHDYDGHDADGCIPACGCTDPGPEGEPRPEDGWVEAMRQQQRVEHALLLAAQWESDDRESLNTYGQHLMGGAVLSCAEQLRRAVAEVIPPGETA